MNKVIFESKLFKRAESNLQGKLKSTFLRNYLHYLVPGYNLNKSSYIDDWNLENIIGLYQGFPYNCDLPKPILPPAKVPRSVLHEEDPALELLTIKSYNSDDINRILNHCQKYKKELEIIHKKDITWDQDGKKTYTQLPKYIAEIAKIMDSDPDPYFKGTYNWYYTGGCLNSVQFKNQNILIFPYADELVASPLNSGQDMSWKPILQKSTKCSLDGVLCELRHQVINNTCIILGRYKNHCNFYKLSNSKNKLKIKEVHVESSSIPYVSADLSAFKPNEYCAVNAERIITLWDISKVNRISSNDIKKITTKEDCWGSIRFHPFDPNLIMFEDRCCLHYFDTRSPLHISVLTLCPKSYLEECENLSVQMDSRHASCRYLGTYHSFLLCDNRSPKQCVQQKWTHQFKSAPLLGSVVNRNDEDILVLSSQIAEENSIILNKWRDNEHSHSFNLPFTPPNIMETLNASQMQGKCLNPYLKTRFELSNVGSTLIQDDNGNVFFFLQNSIGDIFYQCITHEEILNKFSAVNCRSISTLNAWEHALSARKDTVVPLVMSHKFDMHRIYQKFINRKLQLETNEQVGNDMAFSWKQSLDKLFSYTDILAPELLGAWEIHQEIPATISPHQKVLGWLESSEVTTVNSQEEHEHLSILSNVQNLIDVSQEPDITCLDDSNVLQELFLPKVITKPMKNKHSVKR